MIHRVSILLAGAITLALPIVADAKDAAHRSWPKEDGAYIAISMASLPIFPNASPGYRRTASNKDYFGHPFLTKGNISLKRGADWKEIPSFPIQMNKCVYGRYMIRWWSADQGIRIASALGDPQEGTKWVGDPRRGIAGYMQGSMCDGPLFKFEDAFREGASKMVNLHYEVKFWVNTYWWNR